MAGPGISCVVVIDEHSPIGIITERDVVRLVSDGVNLAAVSAGTAMTSPVLTAPVGTTVYKARRS